jgi:hypothetical protein
MPGPGEVLLRNQAVGVAFADVAMREGVYPGHKPPLVPGYGSLPRKRSNVTLNARLPQTSTDAWSLAGAPESRRTRS